MKTSKHYLCFLWVFLTFASCHNTQNSNEVNDTTSATLDDKSTAPIWGVFSDTIPCADCKGIVTKLFLNKDYTFIKEENYIGAQDTLQHIFYDLGKWQIKDSIISLHDQVEGGNNQYKLLPEGNIQMMAEKVL